MFRTSRDRTRGRTQRGVIVVVMLVLPGLGLTGLGTASAAPDEPRSKIARTTGQQVPGAWIVTLRAGADADSVSRRHQAKVRFVYTDALNGFAAELDDGQVRALENDNDVLSLEPDQVVAADVTQPVPVGGGLSGAALRAASSRASTGCASTTSSLRSPT